MYSRPFGLNDTSSVLKLWHEYNKDDVYLPEPSICRFKTVYLTDDHKIIGFSCFNMLPELILVHDKSLEKHKKYELLSHVLDSSKIKAKEAGWIQIYAFLDDDNWIRHLLHTGFNLWQKGLYYLDLRSK